MILNWIVTFLSYCLETYGYNQIIFQQKHLCLKTAAGFTECGSANDRKQLFKNNNIQHRVNTYLDKSTVLKDNIISALASYRDKGQGHIASRWVEATKYY